MVVTWADRIANYERVTGDHFPKSLFIAGDGRVVGTWVMGNDYRVKSSYYGGYPATYLRRMKALMFDKQRTLHLFSGKVNLEEFPGDTLDTNPALNPTYTVDAIHADAFVGPYDLIMADPPYSAEDAEHYGTPMANRNRVIKALASGCHPGTHVVWLDQVLPMFRKDEWRMEALIGMWKSTNHRFRGITIFARI